VALHRILVVDDSPAVRETLGILLGRDYEVHATPIGDYATAGERHQRPDLIIAARAAAARCPPQRFPAGVPVLWIDGPTDASSAPRRGPSIARRFSPRELQRRVAELLAAPALPDGATGLARLRRPYVSEDAARAIGEALLTELPLHLVGEPGTGKRSIARAVHGARASGPFVLLPAADFDPAVLSSAGGHGGTLFLDRVEQLWPHGQNALLSALEPSGLLRAGDGGRMRLITTATVDLGAAADAGELAPDLYYRLTVLTVHLAPLRERADDIPALAQLMAAELAHLLDRSPVAFTDRALERLANYLWFGNLAELEAVLARTIALSRAAVIDADDLLFDGARLPAQRATESPTAGNGAALGARPLDLIINELAHEFKNPLVTIKTFAHHLRRSMAGGGEDDQVARLTGEAVEQIDWTLENLLEFTRLAAPVPQSVPLSAVLNPVMNECGQALAARGVALDQRPLPPIAVRGDPQQLSYALTNLVHALARDLAPSSRLSVRYDEPAALAFELPSGTAPLDNRLATLLDHPSDGSLALPLGVAIANAVLERNGAQVALSDRAASTVIVRFTPVEEYAAITGNGTSARPRR
jgi:DNA-binding NtrC family response regulator